MKISVLLCGAVLALTTSISVSAEHMDHHMQQMHSGEDGRISLGLPPAMGQHQLKNMRAHVAAVRSIVGLISGGNYSKASAIAHAKLGLTDEMKKMCNSFENADFRKLGLAFHYSGDKLGDVLLTKDVNKSLQALHTTMGYCVACHASYRQ